MAPDKQRALPVHGAVPEDWRVVSFGSVLNGGTRTGLYKPKEFHGRGDKLVNMGELFAYPRLYSVPMRRIAVTEEERRRFALSRGDLLFARRSLVAEGAGKCSLVCEVNEPTVFESSIIRARPDPQRADSSYLYYLFSSAYGTYVLDTIRRHVAVAGITGRDLETLPVPLPPLRAQRAIAAILGALDDKIELNRRMNETLEAIAEALFRGWFVDFEPVRAKAEGRTPAGLSAELAGLFPDAFEDSELGAIPRGWTPVKLAELAAINDCTLSARDRLDRIEYIEISQVRRGDIGQVQTYERGSEPGRARRRLRHGDTVLSTVRPDRRAYFLCLNPSPYLIASTGFAVVTPQHAPWSFVHAALTRPEVFAYLGRSADGAAYPAVSPETIEGLQVVVPTDKHILSAFDSFCRPLYELAGKNRQDTRTLAELRGTLLPKLLSGEIRVRDGEREVGTRL